MCAVQSSVYESPTAAERLQHVASVYSRYSSLRLVGGERHGICIRGKLACKLLRQDGRGGGGFLASHGRRRQESSDGRERFRKIHTYIAWRDRLRAAASLHPEGCSTGFSGSDPPLENADLRSTPAALAGFSSIPAGGSGETRRGDKYAGQEVTLRSSQTCANAVVGMHSCVQQATLWHYATLSKNTGIT